MPQVQVPSRGVIVEGFLVLGLAQIPLSLGNSIFATRQLVTDLFPDRRIPARKIAFTYSIMNLIQSVLLRRADVSWLGGGWPGISRSVHGRGDLLPCTALIYIALGVFFSRGFDTAVHLFPLPVLGVILLFEALVLLRLMSDLFRDPFSLTVAMLVGLVALTVPYGILVGLLGGSATPPAGASDCVIAPDHRRA